MLSESHLHEAFYRSRLTDPTFAGSAAFPDYGARELLADVLLTTQAGTKASAFAKASARQVVRSRVSPYRYFSPTRPYAVTP
jgi:hypothetical protein